jgi:putative transposase
MREIDRIYTDKPFYGYPRITEEQHKRGYACNHKRVARLMQIMGLAATVPGPHTSRPSSAHPVYPYLLRGKTITQPDHVWCADITYIPMHAGFLYLVAILDWFSRYVVAWALSNTLEAGFCLDAMREALLIGRPAIFNTDQGAQFTCDDWLALLHSRQIRISLDGRYNQIWCMTSISRGDPVPSVPARQPCLSR